MTNVKATEAQRNSAIELLRIISMLMIVFHHFAVHGGFEFAGITVPRLWYNLILMGGKVGVNVFVLISGYYLVTDERLVFNVKRIFKLAGGGSILFDSVVFGMRIVWLQ